MKRNFGEILGERQLDKHNGLRRGTTTVTLGKPRKKTDGDWECPFRITGLGIQYGYGVDAIQALTSALEGIHKMLEHSGQRLSWLGGGIGHTGFYRPVPSSLGEQLTARLNQVIDREIEKFVDRVTPINQKKAKLIPRSPMKRLNQLP